MQITLEYLDDTEHYSFSDSKCEQHIIDVYNLKQCEHVPFSTENILSATRALIAEGKFDHTLLKLKYKDKIYDFDKEGLLFFENQLCWPKGVGESALNFAMRMLEAQIKDDCDTIGENTI